MNTTKIFSETYIKQNQSFRCKKIRVVYNSDWLSSEFSKLTICGKFTLAQFLERDDFSKRYKMVCQFHYMN